MYKIVFVFIFCSIVLFAKESLSINSVEFSDKKSKQTSNYLEKVFSGEIGVSYSTNDTSNRVAYFGTLRYEDLFYNFIKAKLEYRYTNLNIKKELSLRVDTPGLPNTKTVEKSFTTSGFREAYLDFDLGRYVSFSIGRQVIVWGQFEILSPIDMLLPYEYSTGISSISKVQNRLPQNSAILNIFPSSNFKIAGYYFPKIERDEMVQEIFDAGEVYYDINQKKIEQPDKDEEYRIAMRATYFADNFTFGITYYDGWENFFTEYEYLEPSSRNRLHDDLTIVDYPMVSKVIATGIELSVPINKWTWKLEATQTKSTKGFDPVRLNDYDIAVGEEKDFLDWVMKKNDGKNFVPMWKTWLSAGFDYSSKKWQTNFLLLFVDENIIGKENENRMRQSWEIQASYYNESEVQNSWYYLPFVHTARYFDKDKHTALGFGYGIYGDGFKVFTYFKDVIKDDFTYGISLEMLDLPSDMQLSDEYYESSTTQGLFRLFGLYKF